jgi:hypothetical protein
MSWISSAVGGILSSVGTIGGNLDKDKLRSQMLTLGAKDPTYKESQATTDQYGLAKTLLNARMPGASNMEQNIYATNANANANVDRGATDASQALALKTQNAAGEDKAFSNLGTQEAQDYYSRLGNLNQASDKQAQSDMTSYEDNVRRWQDSMNLLLKRGDIKSSEWQSVSNLGGQFSSMNFGGGGK